MKKIFIIFSIVAFYSCNRSNSVIEHYSADIPFSSNIKLYLTIVKNKIIIKDNFGSVLSYGTTHLKNGNAYVFDSLTGQKYYYKLNCNSLDFLNGYYKECSFYLDVSKPQEYLNEQFEFEYSTLPNERQKHERFHKNLQNNQNREYDIATRIFGSRISNSTLTLTYDSTYIFKRNSLFIDIGSYTVQGNEINLKSYFYNYPDLKLSDKEADIILSSKNPVTKAYLLNDSSLWIYNLPYALEVNTLVLLHDTIEAPHEYHDRRKIIID